jgi:23S rRNA (cytidine2498-2'-O)-methyltransferase
MVSKIIRSAYLGSREYMEPLRSELDKVIDVHDQLALSSALPIKSLWSINTWHNPKILTIDSINDGAKQLKEIQRNWCLYSYQFHRRAKLIQEKLPYLSAKPLRFPCALPTSPIGSWTLLTENQILASSKCSSFFKNGEILFEENKEAPPSRAYLKLYESLTRIEKFPQSGDFCIDAGGSPGGWTWVIQKLGARVLSIDRSPLDAKIASLPNVEYHKGDVFSIKPSDYDKVDWLFSDVVCFPEKLFDWVSLWFESKKCKNFICTIKFQGTPNYSFARKFLEFEGSQVVHLYNNKHELTFIHKE